MRERARVAMCVRVRSGMRCIACAQAAQVPISSCAYVLASARESLLQRLCACGLERARTYKWFRLHFSARTFVPKAEVSVPHVTGKERSHLDPVAGKA